jgi:hypothetical protein
MSFVLWLHVAAAILLLGPLTVATMATPGAIRQGTDGLPLLRWLHRTTRLYGIGSIAVFLLGLAVVPLADDVGFDDGWLSASMGMFLVAWLIVLAIVADQRKAVREVEAGGDAAVRAGRLAALSGIVALLWLAVLALMVFQPGGGSGS